MKNKYIDCMKVKKKLTKNYLFQSRTSENGNTYPSATTTGIQPACKASLNAVCPKRARRITKQNVAF